MPCMRWRRKPSARPPAASRFPRAKISFPQKMSVTSAKTLPAIAQQVRDRIDARTARVGVIGLGYVGLPLALLFSEQKFRVTGFDVDAAKVASLNAGDSY